MSTSQEVINYNGDFESPTEIKPQLMEEEKVSINTTQATEKKEERKEPKKA